MLVNKKAALEVTVVHSALVKAEFRCKRISCTFKTRLIARVVIVLSSYLTVFNNSKHQPPSELFEKIEDENEEEEPDENDTDVKGSEDEDDLVDP